MLINSSGTTHSRSNGDSNDKNSNGAKSSNRYVSRAPLTNSAAVCTGCVTSDRAIVLGLVPNSP